MIKIELSTLKRFLLQMTVSIGLCCVWLILLNIVVLLAYSGVTFLAGKGLLKHLGVLAVLPLIGLALWLTFHMALQFLEDIGIEIHGIAQILIIPVAVPIAVLGFFFGSFAAFGEFAKNKALIILAGSLGCAVLVSIAVVVFRAAT